MVKIISFEKIGSVLIFETILLGTLLGCQGYKSHKQRVFRITNSNKRVIFLDRIIIQNLYLTVWRNPKNY